VQPVYIGEKSDNAISRSLKDALRRSVFPLCDVPARHKDWHPGSNEQVLDLIHPSLFPLVDGHSRILVDRLTTLADFVERWGNRPFFPEEEARLTRSVDPGSFNWDA
jgi:hypothetical protein